MDVRLPSGQVISGIPDGTPKDVIMQKAIASGLATAEDFGQPAEQPKEQMSEEQFTSQYGDIPDMYGQITPEEPAPEPTLGEEVVGAGEAALSAATGMTTGTLGLIGGTFKGLIDELRSGEFGSKEAADRIEKSAMGLMQQLTYAPKTEAGKENIEAIGEVGAALAPLAGLGGSMQQMGQLGKAARPQIAQAAKTALQATKQAAKPAAEVAKGIFQYQSPTKQRIGKLIESRAGDIETAKFKLKTPSENLDVTIKAPEGKLLGGPDIPKAETVTDKFKKILDIGGPKIVKDKVATESIAQGFDEGVIASVKAGSKVDKAKMAKMVDIMEKGKKNKEYAVRNRPSDVAGDSLMERVRSVRDVNKKAGKELESVSNSLKGKDVDSSPAINSFMKDLDDMGVKIVKGKDGKVSPDFRGSDIEDLPAPEMAIKRMIARLAKDKAPNAYELHRVKKYIDENVTYGKSGEGLGGKTESILKNLRRNLDGILDENFPEYDRVNTTYSETIKALDAVQDVAGRKMDLAGGAADKATGTLLRRLMSNAQSRVRLLDSIDEIEGTATKYGGAFDDNLIAQTLFVDELDRVFGPVARTSLQGQVGQAVEGAAKNMANPMGLGDLAVKGVGMAADKARGINEAGAFKSIKELLNEK